MKGKLETGKKHKDIYLSLSITTLHAMNTYGEAKV